MAVTGASAWDIFEHHQSYIGSKLRMNQARLAPHQKELQSFWPLDYEYTDSPLYDVSREPKFYKLWGVNAFSHSKIDEEGEER